MCWFNNSTAQYYMTAKKRNYPADWTISRRGRHLLDHDCLTLLLWLCGHGCLRRILSRWISRLGLLRISWLSWITCLHTFRRVPIATRWWIWLVASSRIIWVDWRISLVHILFCVRRWSWSHHPLQRQPSIIPIITSHRLILPTRHFTQLLHSVIQAISQGRVVKGYHLKGKCYSRYHVTNCKMVCSLTHPIPNYKVKVMYSN